MDDDGYYTKQDWIDIQATERFRRNYDDLAPGLARHVHDAILADASRAGPSRRDHDPGPG